MADNSVKKEQTYSQRVAQNKKIRNERHQKIWEAHEEFCEDQSNWVTVQVPSKDLFDKPFGNISLNLIEYGPGKHFVRPDIGEALTQILAARYKADMRILRPTQDSKMVEIMARVGRPVTTAGTTVQENVVGNDRLFNPYPTSSDAPYPIA